MQYKGKKEENILRFSINFGVGMALSGDKVSKISENKIQMLKKLIPAVNKSAVFNDTSFRVGRTFFEIETKTVKVTSIFNWENLEW